MMWRWLLLPFLATALSAAPCAHTSDLQERGPLTLTVRFDTQDRRMKQQMRKALRYWQTVLALQWRETTGADCSFSVRTDPTLIERDLWGFASTSGWIAMLPSRHIPRRVLYEVSVHEIGHLLGLTHNPHYGSVMFVKENRHGPTLSLDTLDLQTLAGRHTLRREQANWWGGVR